MKKTLPAVFCTHRENDLIEALYQSGYMPELADNAADAIQRAENGTAVLILADDYPRRGTVLSKEILDAARSKQLRLYIEFPESVLGVPTGEAQTIQYERLIAPDGFFGAMEKGSILMLNGCWHRPYFEKKPGALCLAKAAGYDRLAFGLPEKSIAVLDTLDEQNDVWIATSALSNFITGRYAPQCRWKALWEALLAQLGMEGVELTWKPHVDIEAKQDEPLDANSTLR